MARPTKEAHDVTNKLRNLILSNVYTKGDKLPSEAVLTAKFNVSRTTLRKAFANLEQENLIAIKKNCGAYVSSNTPNVPTTLIPVISSTEKDSPLFLDIYHGIQDYFADRNFDILLSLTTHDDGSEKRAVLDYISKGYKDFIIIPSIHNPNGIFYNELIQEGYNLVFVDRIIPSIFGNYISSDNFAGGYLAASELLKLNLQQVYICTEAPLDFANTCYERYQGFLFYLEAKNIHISIDVVIINNDTVTDFMTTLASHKSESIGLFCTNDLLAIRISNQMMNRDFYFPIIGYDNTPSALSLIKITTIEQSCQKMGYLAAQTLHEHILDADMPLCQYKLPVKLIVRESTQLEHRK